MNDDKIADWVEKYCGLETFLVKGTLCIEGDPSLPASKWFLTGDNDMRLLNGWKVDAPEGVKREYVLTSKDGEHYVDLYEGPATECATTRQQAVYNAMEQAHE